MKKLLAILLVCVLSSVALAQRGQGRGEGKEEEKAKEKVLGEVLVKE